MRVRLTLCAIRAADDVRRSPAVAADAAFAKDLKATIALQGLPCDQIVAVPAQRRQ